MRVQSSNEAKSDRAKWGFVISLPGDNRAPIDKPVSQSAKALVGALRQQPVAVQQNGIWLFVTNPAAYSAAEKSIVEDLKRLCKKEKIPLFICRGAELPNGWRRFSSRASCLPYVRSNQPMPFREAQDPERAEGQLTPEAFASRLATRFENAVYG
jgi:hypothetical protein